MSVEQGQLTAARRVRPALVCGIALVLTVGLLPFGSRMLSPTVSFVPALLSVVTCFDLLSVYLLISDFRDNGDPRMLAMCAAYVWSLVVMAGYALSFPGAFAAQPPLALTPSVAPWLYVGWHAGFPVLLGAAWAPWPVGTDRITDVAHRSAMARATVAGTVAAAAGLVTATVVFAHRLPVLIHGRDTSRMAHLTAPVALPLVALALLVSLIGTRGRTGPEVWAPVAVLVCLCDLLLTYSSHYRYSLGWYAGRGMTLTASALVLFAMLVEFRRLKSHAEFYAAYDSLTGLVNRRRAHDGLASAFDLARAARGPLGIVLVDLDFFKDVNDQHGHETGDQLLSAVGKALAAAVRAGDVVGRVGGEEFLAVLPGTDLHGAELVAERMRGAVAALDLPAAGGATTASVGVTALSAADTDPADLLRRADRALYRAKDAGRNRVVVDADPVRALERLPLAGLALEPGTA